MITQIEAFLKLLRPLERSVLKVQYRRLTFIPSLIVLFFVVMAIFAPLIAPYDPLLTDLPGRLAPPFWQKAGSTAHLLGTDSLGRDVWSRIVYGSRVSLLVAFLVIALSGTIGTFVGIISGYVGGRLDAVVMRITDAFLSFPTILIAMLLAATLGASLQNVILAISISMWSYFARVIRGEVLSLRTRDFVYLAKVAGCPHLWITLHHILPNVLNTAMILLSLQIGHVILLEASLSFLGAGIPPPTPSWGNMVAEGRTYLTTAWWLSSLSALPIFLIVIAFNLLGDWLRETLDPKMRQFAGYRGL